MAMLCTTIRWVVAVKDVRARSEHSGIANINNAALAFAAVSLACPFALQPLNLSHVDKFAMQNKDMGVDMGFP